MISVHSISHALRQVLVRQPLHDLDAFAGTNAGPDAADDGGGRIHVVARQDQRAADLSDGEDGAERDHVAVGVAHFQCFDLRNIIAERRLRLDDYLPGAAELLKSLT